MKSVFTSIFLSVCFFTNATNPKFDWVKKIGGIGDDQVSATAIDKYGNVYICGSFNNTVDFDPNASQYFLTDSNPSFGTAFILKLDSFGNFLWARSIGNSSTAPSIAGIGIDEQNNLIITGGFGSTIDFDPNAGVHNLTSYQGNVAGDDDIYVLKLDSNANFIWVKKIGSLGNEYGRFVKIDKQDNIYIAGDFNSSTIDLNPNSGIANFINNAPLYSDNIFLVKLNTNGGYLWGRTWGDSIFTIIQNFSLDTKGNLLLQGEFYAKADFDPSIDTFFLTSQFRDEFLLKIDSLGSFVFAKNIASSLHGGIFWTMEVDNDNSIFLSGRYSGTIDLDPSALVQNITGSGAVLAKYDSIGNLIFIKLSSLLNQFGELKKDADNNLYLNGEGTYSGVIDFDFGQGVYNGQMAKQTFLEKMDANCNLEWVLLFFNGGRLNIDNATKKIYQIGEFNSTVNFAIQQFVSKPLTSSGGKDIFIHRISMDSTINANLNIQNVNDEKILGIFPNPANEVVNLRFHSDVQKYIEVRIKNDYGQTVIVPENFQSKLGINQHEIRIDNLKTGVYFCEVELDSIRYVRKLIIVR